MTKKPCWGAWMRKRARFILTYRLGGEGKAARKIAYKKALYAMGHTSCKPFRKD